jgi:site-specific DNA-methyltransferase (adenine-specific)
MIEITNEDNMALMARYPDKYFDLAIVYPPYGIGADKHNTADNKKSSRVKNPEVKYKKINWDIKPEKEYFTELFRVSRRQIIFGGNYFDLRRTGGWIIWDKFEAMPTLSKCELAWCSFMNHTEIFRYLWAGMRRPGIEQVTRVHPTQKPVALYKWLLRNYAKRGDKILDTHLGSGSIAIACLDAGFDLTGCELERDYYEAAMKRIREHEAQRLLFAPEETAASAEGPGLFDGE